MHQQRRRFGLIAAELANDVVVAVGDDRAEADHQIAHRAEEIRLVLALPDARAMRADREHPADGDVGHARIVRPRPARRLARAAVVDGFECADSLRQRRAGAEGRGRHRVVGKVEQARHARLVDGDHPARLLEGERRPGVEGAHRAHAVSLLRRPAHECERLFIGLRRRRGHVRDADHARPVLVVAWLQREWRVGRHHLALAETILVGPHPAALNDWTLTVTLTPLRAFTVTVNLDASIHGPPLTLYR